MFEVEDKKPSVKACCLYSCILWIRTRMFVAFLRGALHECVISSKNHEELIKIIEENATLWFTFQDPELHDKSHSVSNEKILEKDEDELSTKSMNRLI